MTTSRNSKVEETVRTAIAERRLLVFRYNDVKRSVQPHILGTDRGGHLSLSGWQIAGTGVGWRLFHLDHVELLGLSEKRFGRPAPGYNPADPSFVTVLAQLER